MGRIDGWCCEMKCEYFNPSVSWSFVHVCDWLIELSQSDLRIRIEDVALSANFLRAYTAVPVLITPILKLKQ